MAAWCFSKQRTDAYCMLIHPFPSNYSIRYECIYASNALHFWNCQPLGASSIEVDLRVHGLDSYIFYSKRSSNIQCSLTKSTVSEVASLTLVDNLHIHAYPSVLKIDPSLVNYFISPQTFTKGKRTESPLKETKETIELPYSLSIEWAPYSLSNDSSM